MVKYTQTMLSVFDHFMTLVLKWIVLQKLHQTEKYYFSTYPRIEYIHKKLSVKPCNTTTKSLPNRRLIVQSQY